MRLLPREKLMPLEDWIQQFITDLKPRNSVERRLVCLAARLSWEIERAERTEKAHLAHRVRMAARSGPDTISSQRLKIVHDLGRKLFLHTGPRTNRSARPRGDDDPTVIVRRLEQSAEGCRWMLERWAELMNVLEHGAPWTDLHMIRFVGLQGQRTIEARFDPKLNSLFLAFEVLGWRISQEFWKSSSDEMPLSDPACTRQQSWPELGPRPHNKTEALTLVRSVIDRYVARHQEMLAEHEEIEEEQTAERCDRAALDCSPVLEWHRRYQATLHEDLKRTLETLRRMQRA
jgi:hypothetical protein